MAFAFVALLPACTVPVLRPFRAHRGPGATGGVGMMFSGKDAKNCNNEEGCVPGGSARLSLLNLDGRYGFRSGALGLMIGGYTPGWVNQKSDKAWTALVPYVTGTVQSDVFAIGVSPEAGGESAGAAVGFDFQPLPLLVTGAHPSLFAVTGYARYLRPYRVDSGPDDDQNARVPSWDAGGGVRFLFAFVQYSYYAQSRGVIDYIVYETSNQASSWHTILIGFDINADIVAAADSLAPKPAPPRPEPRHVVLLRKGCQRLCDEQRNLGCGIGSGECYEECLARDVPRRCASDDHALLVCQASGLRCSEGRLVFPRCEEERASFASCHSKSTESNPP